MKRELRRKLDLQRVKLPVLALGMAALVAGAAAFFLASANSAS